MVPHQVVGDLVEQTRARMSLPCWALEFYAGCHGTGRPCWTDPQLSMPMLAWQTSPLKDQVTGGGIAWAFMELPTLLVLMVLVKRWLNSDERRTRAAEGRQVSGGDTELVAYNAYLQSLNRADRAQVDDPATLPVGMPGTATG